MEFIEDWYITSTLGEGAFGEVKLLHNKTTNEFVALKIVQFLKNKETSRKEAEDMIRKETEIHKMLKHENIVKYYGARMEQDIWYIFLEYCEGGELYDRIEPDVGLIPHTKVLSYFNQIISGVVYLHSKGICHRDLKPENILLSKDVIKISDFGFATVYKKDGQERSLTSKCGTYPYLAPEVLSSLKSSKGYKAEPVDVWSCGVILVVMMAGELPWDKADSSLSVEYKSWKESIPTSTSPWNKFDLQTLNFFKRLLCPIAGKRITLEGILEHSWMRRNSTNKRKLDTTCEPTKKPRTSPPQNNSNSNSGQFSSKIFCLSQPDPVILTTLNENNENTEKFCFSQPAQSSEIEEFTPLSRRLVTRMTRFFVKTTAKECVGIVTKVLDEFCYQWKVVKEGKRVTVITITTVDRRKSPLIFKCTVIEIQQKTSEILVLLDFRLSRGDGIEFKRHFLRLKDELRDIELKIGAPLEWLMVA